MSTFAFAATVPGRILIPAPGTSLTLTVVFAATVPGRLGLGQDRHVQAEVIEVQSVFALISFTPP